VVLVFVMALLFQLDHTGHDFLGGVTKILGRDFHPFSLLFAVSGSLMISTIKVPKP
jgi:CDP-diacylglycerol--serine O-phosphatidyltransferase